MLGWTGTPGGEQMIRIALAGFAQGYYAVMYTRYMARLKEVEIVGVCDCGEDDDYVRECAFTTAGEFAKEMNAQLVHSFIALLELKPDAVLICCETAQHAVLARAALEKGVHVFVSKPLCFSSCDTEMLKGAARGKTLLCGNPLKYEKGMEELYTRLHNGEIGEIYSLRVMINHLAMTKQAWERDTARSGGPLGTYGVYLFDLAQWLTGQKLTQVYALADNYGTPEISGPDTVKVLGRGEKKTQFTLELYSAIHHDYPFVQVEAVGTKGTLITRYDNYATVAQTQRGTVLGALRSSDMGGGEMEHFLACVRGEVTERCGLIEMDYVARCVEAAWRSIDSGRPGTLDVKGECR